MTQTIIVFIALSIINVIASTARSLLTINGGKWSASLSSAGYFAFYNIVLIYTVADFPMWEKCIITFCCNLIGVLIVKKFEERIDKNKLRKIEITIPRQCAEEVSKALEKARVPYSAIDVSHKYKLFNLYCETKEQSEVAKNLVADYGAKFFVTESKKL